MSESFLYPQESLLRFTKQLLQKVGCSEVDATPSRKSSYKC